MSESGAYNKAKAKMDYLLLSFLWLISEIIVNPIGNFPLNDDWSYSLTVQHLLQTGTYHPTEWAAMTLITNVLWGTLFCLPAGFSFIALRISTLVAAWLGILGVYWLMMEMRQSRRVALVTALIMAFNPLLYPISNTFMTDSLFLTLMIYSGIFFIRNLKDGSTSNLVLATIFSLGAILSRQVGLAAPLAFAGVALWQRGFALRNLIRATLPLACGILVFVAYQHWLKTTGRLPYLFDTGGELISQSVHHPVSQASTFLRNTFVCLMYLGLFMSPLLFGFGLSRGSQGNRDWKDVMIRGIALVGTAGLAFIYIWQAARIMMPLALNIFDIEGSGPFTLHDYYCEHAQILPSLGDIFWLAVTCISPLGVILILYHACNLIRMASPCLVGDRRDNETVLRIFALSVAAIYPVAFLMGNAFDRYFIPVIPFLAAALLFDEPGDKLSIRKPHQLIAGALLLGMMVLGICGTRDYLAWNRARWHALDELMTKDHIKPTNIDGGFEFNGFYSYNSTYKSIPGKSWWWVQDDTYMVAFGLVPGYGIYRDYPYTHWLPYYTGHIYVLKRNEAVKPKN